jgi:hypothetical protein
LSSIDIQQLGFAPISETSGDSEAGEIRIIIETVGEQKKSV